MNILIQSERSWPKHLCLVARAHHIHEMTSNEDCMSVNSHLNGTAIAVEEEVTEMNDGTASAVAEVGMVGEPPMMIVIVS